MEVLKRNDSRSPVTFLTSLLVRRGSSAESASAPEAFAAGDEREGAAEKARDAPDAPFVPRTPLVPRSYEHEKQRRASEP
jgi:hypothetical protein